MSQYIVSGTAVAVALCGIVVLAGLLAIVFSHIDRRRQVKRMHQMRRA